MAREGNSRLKGEKMRIFFARRLRCPRSEKRYKLRTEPKKNNHQYKLRLS